MRTVPTYEVRRAVARAFSEMYGAELPEYNQFIAPVKASNLEELAAHPDPHVDKEAITEEKHGAIRVPGAAEMRIVTRIFAQMGMEPVEFYDMTILGEKSLPMIATAFRPTDDTIEKSAFRMFCSMLHPASIPADLREEVMAELENNRKVFPKFSARLVALLDQAETQGGLSEAHLAEFVSKVVGAFSMHREKVVDFRLYSKLRTVSDPLADIVLESPVLNHLTPRALNIRDAVAKLVEAGIPMQTVIQGPPIREDGVCIQLNQIARIAAGEEVFVSADPGTLRAGEAEGSSEAKEKAPKIPLQGGEKVAAYMSRIAETLATHEIAVIQHKARFGEIESRGVALTREGEAAYNAYGIEGEPDPKQKSARIKQFKESYPKTHQALHDKGWAYYTYELTDAGRQAAGSHDAKASADLDELLRQGHVALVPQTYNDFLPFSAAAIFAANLTTGTEGIAEGEQSSTERNRLSLEEAMGRPIASRHDFHQRDATRSRQQVCEAFGAR